MNHLTLILLLFAISLLRKVAPSEIANGAPLENANVRSNDIQDSHLERVHVKQESGFDGKVRSIRFSIGPEETLQYEQTGSPSYAHLKPKKMDVGLPDTFNTMSAARMSRDTKMPHIYGIPKKFRLIGEPIAPSLARSTRAKRSTEKNSVDDDGLADLRADESKVFRPLFAYRQQVAKRLRVKNDKQTDSNRRRVQRMNPGPYDYYYPYRYPAYPTVYRAPLQFF